MQGKRSREQRPDARRRLVLEPLEDRSLLSTVPVVADFNNDGKADVVAGDTVVLGNGDGTLQLPKAVSPANLQVVAAGRFRGAGAPLDLVLTDPGFTVSFTGSVDLERGNGDGTFGPPIPIEGGIFPSGVATGHFTHSGNLDLVVTSFSSTNGDAVELFRGNGDGTFQAPVTVPFSGESIVRTVADLNGDGNSDLILGAVGQNNVAVLLGNGDGTFQSPIRFGTGSPTTPNDVVVGQLRGPQAPLDIVTANEDFPGTVSVLLGKGDGTFQTAAHVPIGQEARPFSVALADLNGDGRLDIVTTNLLDLAQTKAGIDVLFGNGNGTFGATQFIPSNGMVSSVVTADLNGDGSPDIVGTGQNLDVFLNRGDGSFVVPNGTQPGVTVTSLTVDANPAVVGQTEVLTATVFTSAGAASGTVTFFDGARVLGAAALDADGRASLSASLGAGPHVLTASFAGNANFTASTSTALTETVLSQPEATTTSLRTLANPGVFGQTETLIATVTAPTGTPTGAVSFFDGGTLLGAATVSSDGQATLLVSLGVGVHSLSASFAANGAFAASTSQPLVQTINPASTTTFLQASKSSVAVGQTAVFTASVVTVFPGTGLPTGTVTFLDGAVVLGTTSLSNFGSATLTTRFVTTGAHTITAVFNGSGNFLGSSATALEQVTTTPVLAPTTTLLTSSSSSPHPGQRFTLTATVLGAPGTGTPTGTVTFMNGNVVIGRLKLDAVGQVRFSTRIVVAGKSTITAVYSGDSNFAASSQSIDLQVA
jgi:Bacterial Ig-like domain (group 3)/FG-GAP-like repeat